MQLVLNTCCIQHEPLPILGVKANATCHCFDHRAASPDAGAGDARTPAAKDTCRLHKSAAGVTRSGAGWTAYWKPAGASASASAGARADADSDAAQPAEWQLKASADIAAEAARAVGDNAKQQQQQQGAAAAGQSQRQTRQQALASGGGGGCAVCTAEFPCLFDLLADPGERTNVASENPEMVKLLQAQLRHVPPRVTTASPARRGGWGGWGGRLWRVAWAVHA